MAVTFKVFLDERRKRNDLTYPLKIRVTVNKRQKEIPLNIYLIKNNWDATIQKVNSNLPNSKLIQLKISKRLIELQENALLLENQGKIFTTSDVIGYKKKKDADFLSFSNELIDNLLKSGRVGNALSYRCAIHKLQKYLGKKNVRFDEIDYKFLEGFTSYMVNGGLKTNGISVYMRSIRAIYNRAIKMELVDIKYYPFLKYKIKSEKTLNRVLTLEEVRAIVNLNLSNQGNSETYQTLFLLSFCLIGINFADLLTLKPDNIINDRVVFHRKKTKKIYSIKIHEKSKKLFECLQTKVINKGNYYLPFINSNDSALKQKNDIGLVIHATNDNLKNMAKMSGINKPISTYYARYSWANIAKSLGYSKDMIAEALGHEYGNRVTGIYLDDYDKVLIDEMNEKVISAVI